MRIQLALDSESFGTAVQKATLVRDYVDILEIGTGFLYRDGLGVCTEFKKLFPEKKILADMKLADGGKHISEDAFDAGADIVTVLAIGEQETIAGAVEAANERGKEIMADLICLSEYAPYQSKLNMLGVHYVCAHMAIDSEISGRNHLEEYMGRLRDVKFNAKLALSGGITLDNVRRIAKFTPHHLVVGRAITRATDIVAMAKAFSEA